MFSAVHHEVLRQFCHLFGRFDKSVEDPFLQKSGNAGDQIDAKIIAVARIVVLGADYPTVKTELFKRLLQMSAETAVAIRTE